MKKIIIIFILAFTIQKAQAQVGVPDTLAYLQTIIANKAFFIGKPFSVLRDSLNIQIKYFSPRSGVIHDISKETSTRFSFYFPQTADEVYLTYPSIVIDWQPYLNASQSDAIWESNNGGGWLPNAISFYSTPIVRDIKIDN